MGQSLRRKIKRVQFPLWSEFRPLLSSLLNMTGKKGSYGLFAAIVETRHGATADAPRLPRVKFNRS